MTYTPMIGVGGETIFCNDLAIGCSSQYAQGGGSSNPSGFPSFGIGKIKLSGVNFNAANGTDTSFPVYLPTGVSQYQLFGVAINNASHTLTTATVGLFTAAGATGTALITAATSVTVATATVGGANSAQFIAGVGTVNTNATTLYFNLTNAEGAAATADVYIYILLF